jgi:hypothetical protein
MNDWRAVGTVSVLSIGLFLSSVTTGTQKACAETFAQKHPRRAEVLGRDKNINRRLNKDYGHLDNHYGQLKREDRAIHQQERFDRLARGGTISRGEKRQLNREENQLNRQINRDLRH